LALDHPLALMAGIFGANRSSTDLPASLICKNSGVPSLWPVCSHLAT
jgi:hypothetical protein